MDPANPAAYDHKFIFLLWSLGDTARARELGHRHPNESEAARALLDYIRRDYDRALHFYVSEPMSRVHFDRLNWMLVQRLYQATNEGEKLRSLADSLIVPLRNALDEAIQAQAGPTTTAWYYAFLGRQYAILGDRETAIRHAETALEEYRISVDAWNYGGLLRNVAQVYLWLGDYGRAIDSLQENLAHENGSSAAGLRLDPFYDPLRDHPRFQALLERYEQPVSQ